MVNRNLGIDIYAGGARDLEIKWINKGERFIIIEDDGLESISIASNISIEA